MTFLAKTVREGIGEDFIRWAEGFAQDLARDDEGMGGKKKVSITQVRDIYGMVKRIEQRGLRAEELEELWVLKPRLAYSAKRHKESKLEKLKEVLLPALDAVCEPKLGDEARVKRFKRFCQGFEAILAYHKAHEKE